MVDILSIFELEIYSQDRFQKLNLQLNFFFFANRGIYFWKKMPDKSKKNAKILKINSKLDNFRKKLARKRIYEGIFLGTIGRITEQNLICL